ncbi:MAG TPA: O-antigen ligase family protein [Ignavibacteria bacterium]|nr:O-antigen ligase family protein [Ignavibacteria bacterium]
MIITVANSIFNSDIRGHSSAIIWILLSVEILLLALLALQFYKAILITVIVIFGVLLLYYFFNNPFILFLTFLLSILAGTVELSSDVSISFVFITFIILTLFYLVKISDPSQKKSIDDHFTIKFLFGFFLIWSLFSVYIAIDKTLAIGYWRNYFAGFITFVYALKFVNTKKQIKIFLSVLIIWGVILSFIELYILFSLGNVATAMVKLFMSKNLLATSWGRSNYLASFHVFIIPIAFGYLMSTKSNKVKFAVSLALILMASTLILTLSRGGMLALLIGMTIFVVKALKPKLLIPLLFLVTILSIILLLNPLTVVIFEGISTVESNASTHTRLNFYIDTWHAFLKHPITGVGLGNLGHYAVFKITNSTASAHNIVLGALGETGIIGAILYLSAIFYSFITSFNNYLREKIERVRILQWSFLCSFIAALAHSMIEPNFEGFQFAILFWGTLAVFLRFSKLKQDEKLNLLGASNQ